MCEKYWILSVFCKWSNLWSKHFVGVFLKRQTAEKVCVYKGFQAFGKLATENRLHAPKRRALPTAPHPEVWKIFDFKSISVSGQICGQTTFLLCFVKRECAKKSVFTRVFEPSKNSQGKTACMLPNQARFLLQLRLCLRSYARHSLTCCHSFLLPFSVTGGGRKRPQLRHTPMSENIRFLGHFP